MKDHIIYAHKLPKNALNTGLGLSASKLYDEPHVPFSGTIGAHKFISEQKVVPLIQLSVSSSSASRKKGHDKGPNETKEVGDHRQPPNSCQNRKYQPDIRLDTLNISEINCIYNSTLKAQHKFEINPEPKSCKIILTRHSNNDKKEARYVQRYCMYTQYMW